MNYIEVSNYSVFKSFTDTIYSGYRVKWNYESVYMSKLRNWGSGSWANRHQLAIL